MNKESKEILELQKIDPLHIAEMITEKSYKESKDTGLLGLAIMLNVNEAKNKRLEEIGDTKFSNKLNDYLEIVQKFGFELVYSEPFKGTKGKDECLYVLFLKELGILLVFDTYTHESDDDEIVEPNVNGGHIYYNWSPNDINDRRSSTSSGGFLFPKRNDDGSRKDGHMVLFEKDLITQYVIPDYPKDLKYDFSSKETWKEFETRSKPVEEKQKQMFTEALKSGKRTLWSGNHDCREALITTIKNLYENGRFFPIWHECAFNWILNYMESKDTFDGSEESYDVKFSRYYQKTKDRLSKMPEGVLKCINNTYKK